MRSEATVALVAVAAAAALASCAARQPPALDPACAQGLALLGSASTDKDLEDARALLEISCGQGSAAGCFHLALLWDRGIGGMEDQEQSLLLLQRSCDLGDGQACALFNARRKMLEWDSGWDSGMAVFWP